MATASEGGREGRQRSGEPEDLPETPRHIAFPRLKGGDEVNQGAVPRAGMLWGFFVRRRGREPWAE
jgi:hypothetical protein